MLTDCRDAEPQEVVFPKETHRSLVEFQSDFFAWCEKQVATWGYDEETSKKYEEMKKKAEELVKARQYDEARTRQLPWIPPDEGGFADLRRSLAAHRKVVRRVAYAPA